MDNDKLAEEIYKNDLKEVIFYGAKDGFSCKEILFKAFQKYHEAKLKEELIKIVKWMCDENISHFCDPKMIVTEYLKTRNNGNIQKGLH